MPLTTNCPQCGRQLRVSEELVGKAVRCPACKQPFPVWQVGFHGNATMADDLDAHETRAEPSDKVPGQRGLPLRGKVGRFELREVLGQGTFGTVYRAYDPRLRRDVALKVPRFDPEEKRQLKWLEEAQAAAALKHPNIVVVYEVSTSDEACYIASEYVAGEPLSVLLQRREQAKGRPDLRQAAEWVRDLARALHYAHGEKIVHRDVKPHNVIMAMVDGRPDRPQLTDFGLAKRVEHDATLTTEGTLIGTPAYMAPEQALGEIGKLGPKSDEYSLGIMLYELLCGRTPFTGPQTAVLYHVIHEAPEPPRAINPDVPRDLETICLKAISKDPADRYRDCGELAEDLRRWLDNEPILARRLGLAERAVRLAQQNPAVASLVGLIFLLTAIALAVTTTLWQRKQAAYRELLETSQRVQDLAESNAAERVRAEAGELAARNAQKAAERLAAERQIALTEAKASAERAIKAEKLAVKAEEVAKAERKKTLDANEELEEMLKKIHQQKARLEQEVAQQRKELYFRNIVEAQKALEEYACYDAENYLDQCPAELRRWEWLYLKHRCFRPEPCHSYFGQGKPVGAVALSPDNQWMASGGTDGLVKIWSSGVPQPLRTLSRHKGPINALAFDQSEGRWLASAGNDKAVCLWDFSRDAPPRERPPLVRSAAITCLTSSPDGQLLATGGADRAVWILRVASPDEVLRLPTPEGQTACLAFSRDGKSLVGGTTGGILRSWSLAGARQRWAAEAHEGAITAVCFSIDGERIASGGADKTLRLWDAAGKPLHAFLGHTATVRGVAFTNDGQRLISGSRDATVRIWDATFRNPEGVSRRALLTLPGRTRDTTPGKKEEKDVTALAISRDGYRVITGSRDETVKVWSAAYDPEVLRFRAHEKPVQSLAYSPDGKRLATASADATIRLWDAADGKAIATLPGHRAFVSHVAFSPDGAQVASASADGTVRVWDATSHFSLREFSAGRGAALCVAFDPDPKRRRIAWGGADSIVRMSSLDGEATVHEFARHHGNVHAIAFSPDGKQLLSAGFDRKIRVWNTVSGQLAATVPPMEGVDAHDETIVTLSFRADGAKLFSGARDGSLRVWTPGKFQAPPSPIHRKRNVRGFAVHPEGTWVALGWDRTVLTLDGTTALVPPSNRGHAVKVLTVAYRGDGRRLASADELGIVKIWDVSRDRPTMTAEAAAPDGTAIVSPAAK